MNFADELGYDEEELARVAAGFGRGMFHGATCGCVTGPLMALGTRYDHDQANDFARKAEMQKKVHEFEAAFEARCGSLYCRKLVPFDFSVEGEDKKAFESGILMERCPGYALAAMEEAGKLLAK
jgi:C_GCAxxG_C_C family probable redox protein